MAFLAAAFVFVAVLCVLNLLLSFGMLRRLRQHTEQLAQGAGSRSSRLTLSPGTPAPDFTASTMDGGTVGLADLSGSPSVLGFFSAGCAPCRTPLPDFVAYADTVPGGAAQVVAVVDGDPAAAADLIEALRGHATIVLEDDLGPVAMTFSVTAYPAFYALDERGKIVSGGPTVRHMTAELV